MAMETIITPLTEDTTYGEFNLLTNRILINAYKFRAVEIGCKQYSPEEVKLIEAELSLELKAYFKYYNLIKKRLKAHKLSLQYFRACLVGYQKVINAIQTLESMTGLSFKHISKAIDHYVVSYNR